jgi:hypothetical protein
MKSEKKSDGQHKRRTTDSRKEERRTAHIKTKKQPTFLSLSPKSTKTPQKYQAAILAASPEEGLHIFHIQSTHHPPKSADIKRKRWLGERIGRISRVNE